MRFEDVVEEQYNIALREGIDKVDFEKLYNSFFDTYPEYRGLYRREKKVKEIEEQGFDNLPNVEKEPKRDIFREVGLKPLETTSQESELKTKLETKVEPSLIHKAGLREYKYEIPKPRRIPKYTDDEDIDLGEFTDQRFSINYYLKESPITNVSGVFSNRTLQVQVPTLTTQTNIPTLTQTTNQTNIQQDLSLQTNVQQPFLPQTTVQTTNQSPFLDAVSQQTQTQQIQVLDVSKLPTPDVKPTSNLNVAPKLEKQPEGNVVAPFEAVINTLGFLGSVVSYGVGKMVEADINESLKVLKQIDSDIKNGKNVIDVKNKYPEALKRVGSISKLANIIGDEWSIETVRKIEEKLRQGIEGTQEVVITEEEEQNLKRVVNIIKFRRAIAKKTEPEDEKIWEEEKYEKGVWGHSWFDIEEFKARTVGKTVGDNIGVVITSILADIVTDPLLYLKPVKTARLATIYYKNTQEQLSTKGIGKFIEAFGKGFVDAYRLTDEEYAVVKYLSDKRLADKLASIGVVRAVRENLGSEIITEKSIDDAQKVVNNVFVDIIGKIDKEELDQGTKEALERVKEEFEKVAVKENGLKNAIEKGNYELVDYVLRATEDYLITDDDLKPLFKLNSKKLLLLKDKLSTLSQAGDYINGIVKGISESKTLEDVVREAEKLKFSETNIKVAMSKEIKASIDPDKIDWGKLHSYSFLSSDEVDNVERYVRAVYNSIAEQNTVWHKLARRLVSAIRNITKHDEDKIIEMIEGNSPKAKDIVRDIIVLKGLPKPLTGDGIEIPNIKMSVDNEIDELARKAVFKTGFQTTRTEGGKKKRIFNVAIRDLNVLKEAKAPTYVDEESEFGDELVEMVSEATDVLTAPTLPLTYAQLKYYTIGGLTEKLRGVKTFEDAIESEINKFSDVLGLAEDEKNLLLARTKVPVVEKAEEKLGVFDKAILQNPVLREMLARNVVLTNNLDVMFGKLFAEFINKKVLDNFKKSLDLTPFSRDEQDKIRKVIDSIDPKEVDFSKEISELASKRLGEVFNPKIFTFFTLSANKQIYKTMIDAFKRVGWQEGDDDIVLTVMSNALNTIRQKVKDVFVEKEVAKNEALKELEEIVQKVSDYKAQKQQLETEIQQIESKLKELNAQKTNLANRIKEAKEMKKTLKEKETEEIKQETRLEVKPEEVKVEETKPVGQLELEEAFRKYGVENDKDIEGILKANNGLSEADNFAIFLGILSEEGDTIARFKKFAEIDPDRTIEYLTKIPLTILVKTESGISKEKKLELLESFKKEISKAENKKEVLDKYIDNVLFRIEVFEAGSSFRQTRERIGKPIPTLTKEAEEASKTVEQATPEVRQEEAKPVEQLELETEQVVEPVDEITKMLDEMKNITKEISKLQRQFDKNKNKIAQVEEEILKKEKVLSKAEKEAKELTETIEKINKMTLKWKQKEEKLELEQFDKIKEEFKKAIITPYRAIVFGVVNPAQKLEKKIQKLLGKKSEQAVKTVAEVFEKLQKLHTDIKVARLQSEVALQGIREEVFEKVLETLKPNKTIYLKSIVSDRVLNNINTIKVDNVFIRDASETLEGVVKGISSLKSVADVSRSLSRLLGYVEFDNLNYLADGIDAVIIQKSIDFLRDEKTVVNRLDRVKQAIRNSFVVSMSPVSEEIVMSVRTNIHKRMEEILRSLGHVADEKEMVLTNLAQMLKDKAIKMEGEVNPENITRKAVEQFVEFLLMSASREFVEKGLEALDGIGDISLLLKDKSKIKDIVYRIYSLKDPNLIPTYNLFKFAFLKGEDYDKGVEDVIKVVRELKNIPEERSIIESNINAIFGLYDELFQKSNKKTMFAIPFQTLVKNINNVGTTEEKNKVVDAFIEVMSLKGDKVVLSNLTDTNRYLMLLNRYRTLPEDVKNIVNKYGFMQIDILPRVATDTQAVALQVALRKHERISKKESMEDLLKDDLRAFKPEEDIASINLLMSARILEEKQYNLKVIKQFPKELQENVKEFLSEIDKQLFANILKKPEQEQAKAIASSFKKGFGKGTKINSILLNNLVEALLFKFVKAQTRSILKDQIRRNYKAYSVALGDIELGVSSGMNATIIANMLDGSLKNIPDEVRPYLTSLMKKVLIEGRPEDKFAITVHQNAEKYTDLLKMFNISKSDQTANYSVQVYLNFSKTKALYKNLDKTVDLLEAKIKRKYNDDAVKLYGIAKALEEDKSIIDTLRGAGFEIPSEIPKVSKAEEVIGEAYKDVILSIARNNPSAFKKISSLNVDVVAKDFLQWIPKSSDEKAKFINFVDKFLKAPATTYFAVYPFTNVSVFYPKRFLQDLNDYVISFIMQETKTTIFSVITKLNGVIRRGLLAWFPSFYLQNLIDSVIKNTMYGVDMSLYSYVLDFLIRGVSARKPTAYLKDINQMIAKEYLNIGAGKTNIVLTIKTTKQEKSIDIRSIVIESKNMTTAQTKFATEVMELVKEGIQDMRITVNGEERILYSKYPRVKIKDKEVDLNIYWEEAMASKAVDFNLTELMLNNKSLLEYIKQNLTKADQKLFKDAQKRLLTTINGTIERINRFAFYLDRRLKGYTISETVRELDKLHFDYSLITPFERNVLNEIFFFYTFFRKTLSLTIDIFKKRATVIANALKVRYGLESDETTVGEKGFFVPVGVEGQNIIYINISRLLSPLANLETVEKIFKNIAKTAEFWNEYNKVRSGGGEETVSVFSEVLADSVIDSMGIVVGEFVRMANPFLKLGLATTGVGVSGYADYFPLGQTQRPLIVLGDKLIPISDTLMFILSSFVRSNPAFGGGSVENFILPFSLTKLNVPSELLRLEEGKIKYSTKSGVITMGLKGNISREEMARYLRKVIMMDAVKQRVDEQRKLKVGKITLKIKSRLQKSKEVDR